MTPDFTPGVNLPVLLDAYNHDLAPNERFPDWGYEFEPLLAFRYLAICRQLGMQAVRIWLCENGEGLRTDKQGRLTGVMPELIDSVRCLQDGARVAGIRLYWTLLDANAWQRNQDAWTGAIARCGDDTARFCDSVVQPIVRQLDPQLTFALEVFNEPENLSEQVVGAGGIPWPDIVRAIRMVRQAVRAAQPGMIVTSGTEPAFLPGLLSDRDREAGAAVDAVDLHFYHPDGGLPSRTDLPVDIGDLPLWAGECGLSHRARSGNSRYLLHYFHNACRLGYQAAFLWKLEGEGLPVQRRENQTSPDRFEITNLGTELQHLLCSQRFEC